MTLQCKKLSLIFEFSGALPGGIIKTFHCSFPVTVFSSIFSLRLITVTETRCWNPKKELFAEFEAN